MNPADIARSRALVAAGHATEDAAWFVDNCSTLLEHLQAALDALEHERKLHALAEQAMRSCAEASKAFERLAQRHFDLKEPLERVADAARALLAQEETLVHGDSVSTGDLRRALEDPLVKASWAEAEALLKFGGKA